VRVNPAHHSGKLKVLVVDNFKYMRSLVAIMLDQQTGNTVTITCDSIDRAMDDLDRFEPDIVITDWNLEFIRRVRDAKTSPNPCVPIIMLTGRAELPLVIQARDAGVNEFLAKPVSAKALYGRITAAVLHPRPFIRTPTYFGPDRRRQKLGPPDDRTGERRRKTENEAAGSGDGGAKPGAVADASNPSTST
jgi:DNA-binding response OmpR family regulator